jgi:cell division protein FtsB
LRSQAGNKSKLWFRLKLALASIAVIAFAGWLTFAEGGFIDNSGLAREREAQADRIALLEARKLKIQEYLDKLEKGDELAMETAARRYGLVSATESIYRIKVESEAKN